ncbi:MAG TPA: HAMP domain-containing sensor histidine kinase, partial [Candidatus Binataceae bacterium]|nr:HAMP domain-containing sensor histidine kinase [Candidatus Binataceae bacterium]
DARTLLNQLSAERDLGPGRRVRLLVGDQIWFDQGDQKTELPTSLPEVRIDRVVDGGHDRYRFALIPLVFEGKESWLQNGVDAGPVRATIARLRDTLLLALPVILILCVTGGYLLSARALAPVSALAAALEGIGERDLEHRLPQPKTEDEIGSLVDSINRMLGRLQQAATSQRRFVSEAAHELRTPLTVLRSGLEVALRQPRDAAQNRLAITEALAEVERLCGIAEDLLALARLELVPPANYEITDLAELASEAGHRANALAGAKDQQLIVNTNGPLLVRASKNELARVLLNLLDNAIKFAPERGVVRLDLSREGGVARLAVSDSGPGIASGELDRVFDPFYTSPRLAAAGSGLGLALSRQIVALHDGTIKARNLDGGGCEIEIRLPALTPNINVC